MQETFARPRFVAVSGPAPGQTIPVPADDVTIGRDASSAIVIPDRALSRRHCALSHDERGWVLRDLGSVNGTIVNGRRIEQCVLEDGDHVQLGTCELLFRASVEPSPFSHPPPAETATLRVEDSVYLRGVASSPEGAGSDDRIQRDLRELVRIGTLVASVEDRARLEQEIVEAAFELVRPDHATLVRCGPAERKTTVASTRTREGVTAAPPSRTAVAHVISHRHAILWTGVEDPCDLARAESVVGAQVTNILAAPLMDDRQVAAVVYLSSSTPGPPFDRLDLETIAALAGIGSIALGNVRRIELLKEETERLRSHLPLAHDIIGRSAAIARVLEQLAKVAASASTVLIRGETGTGKELAARAVHANSTRASGPFVAVNCAAIADTLLEAELFGHERGAFSGAVSARSGRFELADRGTLFLDEVGEMSPQMQAKLLRVLQEREFERVGGTRRIKVDVRIVSATNRDLEREVADGRFRVDLLYRLNVVGVDMPPLRSRREDIPALARYFADKAARRAGRRVVRLSSETERLLAAYAWPGNVRELENVMERAVVLSDGPDIEPEDLPETLLADPLASPGDGESRFQAAITAAKRSVIQRALAEAGGTVTEAARLLGLHPNYLHRLLGSLNLRSATSETRPGDEA